MVLKKIYYTFQIKILTKKILKQLILMAKDKLYPEQDLLLKLYKKVLALENLITKKKLHEV